MTTYRQECYISPQPSYVKILALQLANNHHYKNSAYERIKYMGFAHKTAPNQKQKDTPPLENSRSAGYLTGKGAYN